MYGCPELSGVRFPMEKPDKQDRTAGTGLDETDETGQRTGRQPDTDMSAHKTVIDEEQLLRHCRDAAAGTDIAPEHLANWLIEQGDSGWFNPCAVRRWVELIQKTGWPK